MDHKGTTLPLKEAPNAVYCYLMVIDSRNDQFHGVSACLQFGSNLKAIVVALFSNDIGEKNFRLSTLKMKDAGSFRSADGISNFCSVFSSIDTVRKNEGNTFGALTQLFNNSCSLAFSTNFCLVYLNCYKM